MADEVKTPAVAEEMKAPEASTPPADAPTEAPAEEKEAPSAEGGEAAAPGDAAEGAYNRCDVSPATLRLTFTRLDKAPSSPKVEAAANGADGAEAAADAAPAVAGKHTTTPHCIAHKR